MKICRLYIGARGGVKAHPPRVNGIEQPFRHGRLPNKHTTAQASGCARKKTRKRKRWKIAKKSPQRTTAVRAPCSTTQAPADDDDCSGDTKECRTAHQAQTTRSRWSISLSECSAKTGTSMLNNSWANSLSPGQGKRTMREQEVQIANSGFIVHAPRSRGWMREEGPGDERHRRSKND
jgi:hypothetical protein